MLMLPPGVNLNAFYCDYPGSRNWRSAIVIPARDEQMRIRRCLHAIAEQHSARLSQTLTVVVANNCGDATVSEALATAREAQLPMCLLDLSLDDALGVGTARKVGTQAAIDFAPSVAAILTTDADCTVARNWLAKNLQRLEEADVVCGRLVPEPGEIETLAAPVRRSLNLEARYREACRVFLNLVAPGESSLAQQLSPANGASLAFRYHALLAAGGFSDELTNEDREIIRRARRAGAKVVYADDVVVTASCRLEGRAPGGMADTLARWENDRSSLEIDLPTLTQLLMAVLGEMPDGEPPRPMRLADLALASQRLEALNDLLGQLPGECRQAYIRFFSGRHAARQPPLVAANPAEGVQPRSWPGGFDRSV